MKNLKSTLVLTLGAVLLSATAGFANSDMSMNMEKMSKMHNMKNMDIATCEKMMTKMHNTSSVNSIAEEKNPFAMFYTEGEN